MRLLGFCRINSNAIEHNLDQIEVLFAEAVGEQSAAAIGRAVFPDGHQVQF